MDSIKVFLMTLLVMASPALAKYQDMTQVLDVDNISYMPGTSEDRKFSSRVVAANQYGGPGTFVGNNFYQTMEHIGTHIDSPYHFSGKPPHMDEVPLTDLIGPLVRIDIRQRANQNRATTVSVQDLLDWEAENGRIPQGSLVIMYSGWEEFYGDTVNYVGTEGAVSFPGFGEEVSNWLLANRNIKGIGVDTLSCDSGTNRTVHETIVRDGKKVCFENLRGLADIPACGAKIYGLPIIMKDSTGAQGRVLAEWYDGTGYMTDCNGKLLKGTEGFKLGEGHTHPHPPPATPVIQDLTWVLDEDFISYMPGTADDRKFKYEVVVANQYNGPGTFVGNNRYSTMEHVSTHIDSPYHFSGLPPHMDEVPVTDLIGALVRIDIRQRAQQDRSTTVSSQDLRDWESTNGRIPDGAYVIMYSGWEEYYGNDAQYAGTVGAISFPGFSKEAVDWLFANGRNIKGIGVDTLSCDSGLAREVHETLLRDNKKICFENLRRLGQVPACGAKIYGLPIPMKDSTGAQGRVFAMWVPGTGYMTDCNGQLQKGIDGFPLGAGNAHLGSAMVVLLAATYALVLAL